MQLLVLSYAKNIGIRRAISSGNNEEQDIIWQPQIKDNVKAISNYFNFNYYFKFTLKILGSSPILSALARQWSFAGAPVFVSVFFLSSRVKVVHFKRKVGGGGIRSLDLPILG